MMMTVMIMIMVVMIVIRMMMMVIGSEGTNGAISEAGGEREAIEGREERISMKIR